MTKNNLRKIKAILNSLTDKKAINPTAFNVTRQSGYTDFIVFVTGTSIQHNKAMCDVVTRTLKAKGFFKPAQEGTENSKWILIDAGDVIVNVMLDEVRHYYDLETLWSKSEKITLNSL